MRERLYILCYIHICVYIYIWLICIYIYWFMDVSENRGTPKSSILIGFSIINHPFWGTPIFGNTHMSSVLQCLQEHNYILPRRSLSVVELSSKRWTTTSIWKTWHGKRSVKCLCCDDRVRGSDHGRSWHCLWLSFCWLRMVILQWFKSFPWVSRRQLSLKICKLASDKK